MLPVTSARVRALVLGALCALFAGALWAHDLITAESAERWLAQAAENRKLIQSHAPAAQRAQAHYALGRMLDDIRDLLNRDIAAHGRVQGLATQYLVAELEARGTPLATEPGVVRFPANLEHYREALRLAPEGRVAGDAAFRLLQGYFYDSFVDDPLAPRGQSWMRLQQQIALAEDFLTRNPAHPEREEAQFILAVHYVQAARSAPDAAARMTYAQRAGTALSEFRRRYPDSMRVAAIEVLMEGLDTAQRQ